MNIIHPNELEIYQKYQSILIGEVGYSHGLTISYEDWPGFLEFVKSIDVELHGLPQA